jgi:hypothetical protein
MGRCTITLVAKDIEPAKLQTKTTMRSIIVFMKTISIDYATRQQQVNVQGTFERSFASVFIQIHFTAIRRRS